jgi:hypothetical protein
MVVGAGRRPLVIAALIATKKSDRRIRVCVGKNPIP